IEPAVSTTPQPRRKLRDGIEPDLRRMNRDLRTYRKVRRSPSVGAAIWTAVVRKSSDSSAGRAGQFRASSKIYVTVAPSLSLDFSSFAMRRSWVRIPSRPPDSLIHKGLLAAFNRPFFFLGKTWERNQFSLINLRPSSPEQLLKRVSCGNRA